MGSIADPLLPKATDDRDGGYGSDVVSKEEESGRSRMWTEVKRQYDLAGALVIASLMQYSIMVIATMFVGHLGVLELSSASLATSFAGVTGFTAGLSTGLETLCGQAYGAKNYHLLGVYVQAAILVLVAVAVPISILWQNMETILVALAQDPQISIMAGAYFNWLWPSLFAAALTQPIGKFLQAQSCVLPIMWCSVITVLAHIPTCYFLVITWGAFHGGALAVSIAYYVNLILLLGYVYFSNKLEQTWNGLSKEAFGAVWMYLKLGVPSLAMICLEYWAFEILVLFAGLLPNPQLQVSLLSICLTTGALTYMIPYGLSGVVSTRVSNELGANRPAAAKFAVKVVVYLAVAIASIIAMTELIVRNLWGRAFTADPEVVAAVAKVMPFIAGAAFFDGVQGVLSGVARGCGWQDAGAWVNLGSYYGLGLPSAFLFGFYFQYGALGLWMGFYTGLAVQVSILATFTVTTDWQKMAENARKRVNAANGNHASSPLLG